jgi:hypothetical protein
MQKFIKCAVALAAVVASVQVRADLVIDNFTIGVAADVANLGNQSVQSTGASPSPSYSTSDATTNDNILGGQRDIIIQKTVSPSPGSRVLAEVDITQQRFTFSQDVSTAGYATLRYDGSGTNASQAINTAGLGSVCVSCSAIGFVFEFGSDSNFPGVPVDPFSIQIEVWAAGGTQYNSFVEAVPGTGGPDNLVPGFVLLTEAAWTTGFASFAWDKVSALQITFNSLTPRAINVDFAFTQPRAIPEPAGIALAGLALVAAGVARRRSKGRQA